MMDFVLCFMPSLMTFFLIKNDVIKYVVSIIFLILGAIALIELNLMHHADMHK